MKNFVELTGELVCSYWDRFIAFIRGVLYHWINDESLNKYFYRGQDDNNKVCLIQLLVAPTENAPMLRLRRSWKRSLKTITRGALEG